MTMTECPLCKNNYNISTIEKGVYNCKKCNVVFSDGRSLLDIGLYHKIKKKSSR